MTALTPTPEQAAILDAVKTSSANLIIEALAGAAKTTTLVMLANKLPLQPTLSVAFNKRIAEEMKLRMPSHITSQTMNSIGHGVWGKRLGKRLQLDTGKTYGLVKSLADAAKGERQRYINDTFSDLMRATRLAKANGYIPPGNFRQLGATLFEEHQFFDDIATELNVDPDDEFISNVNSILESSITLGFEGTIDFDDQLYMPTLFGAGWPQYPIILVDEAQDLSPLNHLMLEKMYAGRLIAVGDPYQSIYGFRGAHASSMEYLVGRFGMQRLSLSVSFRCPRAIVQRANSYVPHMQYPTWAAEGAVNNLLGVEWGEDLIPDDGVIICRSNAPLFSMALRLLRKGRSCKIVGNELGPQIIKQLKKFGKPDLPSEDLMQEIAKWRTKELRTARESRKAVIEDRAACYEVFASFGATLGEAVAYAEHIFAAKGQISLMTGHKAKGLEFDTVFHLDPWRIPSKYALRASLEGDQSKLIQEKNLGYVILTRTKQNYYEVNLEDFV